MALQTGEVGIVLFKQTDGLKRQNSVDTSKNIPTCNAVLEQIQQKITNNARSDISDCNDAPIGFYCNNGMANAPSSYTGYVYILTLSYNNDNNYKIQFGFIINNDDIYIRNRIAGNWTNWVKKT